jgi:hypothetical protein
LQQRKGERRDGGDGPHIDERGDAGRSKIGGQREVGNMEAWMLLAFQPDAMVLEKNRGEAQPTT